MLRQILFFLCVLSFTFRLDAQQSWKSIQKAKKGLVEIHYYDSENYIIEKNGKLCGIEYDLIQSIFSWIEKKYKVDIDLRFIRAESFGNLYENVRFGQAGQFGACSFSKTPERLQEVLFTPRYMPDIEVLICHGHAPVVEDSSNFYRIFKNATAFVVKNTTFEQDILKLKPMLPGLKIKYLKTGVEILEHVEKTPNSIGYAELPNYLGAISKGMKINRQALFKAERAGHGIIMPKKNDWLDPINAFFKETDFPKKMARIIRNNLGNDVKDLILEIDQDQSTSSEINLLNKEVDIQRMELEKQEMEAATQVLIRNISIIAVIVVLLIAALLYYLNQVKQKTNKLLQIQNDEISAQKQIIEISNKNILDSISYARTIQSCILPNDDEMKTLLPDSFVFYRPKDIISGDFYFIGKPTSSQGKNISLFAVGDCTGHGVPGALLSIIGKTFLQLGVTNPEVKSCADSLNFLNEGLINILKSGQRTIRDGMDISLCALNHDTLELEFAGGNNPGYIIRGSEIFMLEPDKHAIGDFDNEGNTFPFRNTTFQLQKGDCIYLFSDGYADQFGGPKGKKFRISQLREYFLTLHNVPMNEQGKLFEDTFLLWMGEQEQIDDVCLMGVRV